jgi:2-methylcitrate dehydratase PrpD
LNEQQMLWALGIAATQASGLREMFGTMCKPFHPGNAARNGLLAALLAQQGFTSSNQGIEAPRGFANVLATARNYDEITNRLGETWELAINSYKPFACGVVIHPAIDGAIQLRNKHRLSAEDIESVSLDVHPLVLELTGKKTPAVGLEGKFSVYHSVAVAIIQGAGGEAQYSDEAVRDPRVMALRDRVSAAVDRSIHEDQVRIRILLKDGRKVEQFVEHALGSKDHPIDDRGLEAKFRGLTEGILSTLESERLMSLCWNVEALQDAAEVARASVPAGKAVLTAR